MLVFAMISYAMPLMTGRKVYEQTSNIYAFWLAVIGMLGMTTAFAAAGVAQVYLERRVGLDFMVAQQEIEVHFLVLILCATLFTTGVLIFVYNFIKYGRPTEEAMASGDEFEAVQPAAA